MQRMRFESLRLSGQTTIQSAQMGLLPPGNAIRIVRNRVLENPETRLF
jgi:hypothetical protein